MLLALAGTVLLALADAGGCDDARETLPVPDELARGVAEPLGRLREAVLACDVEAEGESPAVCEPEELGV